MVVYHFNSFPQLCVLKWPTPVPPPTLPPPEINPKQNKTKQDRTFLFTYCLYKINLTYSNDDTGYNLRKMK